MRLEIYTYEGCKACKANKPLHSLLEKTYPTTIIDPTTDDGAEKAYQMNVQSAPTILIIGKDGQVKHVLIGAVRQQEVFSAIGDVIAAE